MYGYVFGIKIIMLRSNGVNGDIMADQDNNKLHQLKQLKIEHRDLDDVIERLSLDGDVDQLQMRRLKKRKLYIKDQILIIESGGIPDIIA